MTILGIDTSCDDTSVAIVDDGTTVRASLLSSQVDVHALYDGVVPELAARKHLEAIMLLIDGALKTANVRLDDIDAIAVTNRPGLIGSLLVGVGAAKALAFTLKKPLIPINHISAHIYSVHLSHTLAFPYIALVVSGGHTLICEVTDHDIYAVIGTTIDDAVGEAYDKIAKFYKLGFPGGPIVDKLAALGDENAIAYPRPKVAGKHRFDFSYSGLKTAVVYQTEQFLREGKTATMENICASFQKSAVGVLYDKVTAYARESGIRTVGISGGVAANSYLRKLFSESREISAHLPERKYTTDNAAMVAGLGYHLAGRAAYDDHNIPCASRVIEKRR
ncbi:MAG: tRNA (adenosine(37)-N6)-threonylcarbamoyltransferase complex transferase subunit TsaD [Spirochaetota bacterium]